MHESVMTWVNRHVNSYELHHARVLEVGSYNENGTVRDLFAPEAKYVGVDMRDGPCVDYTMEAHLLPAEWLDAFDVVVSTEMLEHDQRFWLSLPRMGACLRSGGYMLLTTRGNGFPEHAYPHDYWRFMPESGPRLLELADCTPIEVITDPQQPGLFMFGRKQ